MYITFFGTGKSTKSTKYPVTTLLRDKLTIELAVETVVNQDRRMNEFLWHELRIEAPLRQIIRPPAVHALMAPYGKIFSALLPC